MRGVVRGISDEHLLFNVDSDELQEACKALECPSVLVKVCKGQLTGRSQEVVCADAYEYISAMRGYKNEQT